MKLSSPVITHFFRRLRTPASSWFGMTVTQGATLSELSWQMPTLCTLSTDLRSGLLRTQIRPSLFKPSKGPLITLGRKSKPVLWPTKRYRIWPPVTPPTSLLCSLGSPLRTQGSHPFPSSHGALSLLWLPHWAAGSSQLLSISYPCLVPVEPFPRAMKKSLSHVQLFATPWSV